MPKNIIKSDFSKIVANIKNEIRTTQTRTIQQVNSNLINMYFKIGKILAENSNSDIYFITKVATEIRLSFPNLKGFSARNLQYMRLFYHNYKNDKTAQQLVAQLPWGHNIIILSKIKGSDIRKIYIEACLKNGWSRNILDMQIKSGYHKRIGTNVNNFEDTLVPIDSNLAKQTFKDPYIFDFLTLHENYKEKELENDMIAKIRDVLLELGNGFSYIGNQYKITVGNEEYYIDLLFYHLKLKCYIVVELKTTKYIPEFAGKMNFYLSAIDDTLKDKSDNPSIGLILCKENNKITAQYALKGINRPIGISSYKISNYLPTEKDLNLYINKENP